ncbi:MAG: hypothetical protein ACKPEA_08350, partial [Planctomycetota bacterium]
MGARPAPLHRNGHAAARRNREGRGHGIEPVVGLGIHRERIERVDRGTTHEQFAVDGPRLGLGPEAAVHLDRSIKRIRDLQRDLAGKRRACLGGIRQRALQLQGAGPLAQRVHPVLILAHHEVRGQRQSHGLMEEFKRAVR